MGLAYNVYLNSDKIFGCKNCKTHLASHEAIISRVSGPSLSLPSSFLLPFHPMRVSFQSPHPGKLQTGYISLTFIRLLARLKTNLTALMF